MTERTLRTAPVSYGAAALYGLGIERQLLDMELASFEAMTDAQIEREEIEAEAEAYPTDWND